MPYTRVSSPENLRRLLSAVLMISADVDLPDLLQHFVEEACSLVDARYGALGVLDETRTGLEQFVTHGLSARQEAAIGPRPTGQGVLGLLISEPAPLRLDNLAQHPESYGFPKNHPPMTSFLGVPVRVRDTVYGNLYLTEKMSADAFDEEDEALVEALALAAGIAIQNTRLRDRVRTLSVIDDRERIARELHDRVIQRIFAVGMTLQAATYLPELEQTRERIAKCVDDLDATITEVRTAIFELGEGSAAGGLRSSVIRLAEEMAGDLGARPDVVFSGPIDTAIPGEVADHVLAAVRQGLSNSGQHAKAAHFRISLSVNDDINLEISDDGRPDVPDVTAGPDAGFADLCQRAADLGGTCLLSAPPEGGTLLSWRVPL